MKTFGKRAAGTMLLMLTIITLTLGFSHQKAVAQPGYDDGISYQVFYDELAPYGQWFHDPQYGYVWSPNTGRDFRPYYTNGYWAMTEYGNTWVSNYPWGWAPFHYGRWTFSNYYGWIWIPGNEWGPAWVSWRQGGGYYGWAPLGPGININISFGPRYMQPHDWWTFIPFGNIYSRSFHRYYSPRRTVNIINNTTIINNTYVDNRTRNTYITGPRRTEVEKATRQKVTVYNIDSRSRAGASSVSGQNLTIYRPRVTESRSRTEVAPRQVQRLETSVISNNGQSAATGARNAASNRNNAVGAQERQTAQPANRQASEGLRQNADRNNNVTVERAQQAEANRREAAVQQQRQNAQLQQRQAEEQRAQQNARQQQQQAEMRQRQEQQQRAAQQRQVQQQAEVQRRQEQQQRSMQREQIQPRQNVQQPNIQQREARPQQRIERAQPHVQPQRSNVERSSGNAERAGRAR
jgi:DNA segregation ATPase FtsK/SpoIIIE-like protein